MNRKGIILCGGTGSRLYPLTVSVNKHLLQIYDKPMIYYPLSVLMLIDIQEILLITNREDQPAYEKLLGDGSEFGIQITYQVQDSAMGLAQAFHLGADFVGTSPSCLILGDNFFYGAALVEVIRRANDKTDRCTIFGYHVANPQDYGVLEFDSTGRVTSLEEKPQKPKSNWAAPGLYFYDARVVDFAKSLKPSARNELEITDLNRCYMASDSLYAQPLGRGTAWLDMGSHENLLQAADYVRVIQNRQGLKVACLEEIAFEKDWISREQLARRAEACGKSSYGDYLRMLIR